MLVLIVRLHYFFVMNPLDNLVGHGCRSIISFVHKLLIIAAEINSQVAILYY